MNEKEKLPVPSVKKANQGKNVLFLNNRDFLDKGPEIEIELRNESGESVKNFVQLSSNLSNRATLTLKLKNTKAANLEVYQEDRPEDFEYYFLNPEHPSQTEADKTR